MFYSNWRKKILKEVSKKKQLTYRGTKITFTPEFSSGTVQERSRVKYLSVERKTLPI